RYPAVRRDLSKVSSGAPTRVVLRVKLAPLTNPLATSIIGGPGVRRLRMDSSETSTQAEQRPPFSLDRLRLRFRDPALESAYRDDRFRHNVGNIRFAFLAGTALGVVWGLLLRPHILA